MSGARPWFRSESMRAFTAGVGRRDHAALAGRQLLVGIEAEHRRMAAAADRRAVGVDGAERLAGVLDDRQPEALEGRQIGGVAEDVDRQQRRRARRDRRRGRGRIEVQRARVDVGEHGPRALEDRGVRARDERERRGDDLVSVAHPGGPQREVQAGRAARDGAGVGDAEPRGERLLEGRHARPERELPGAQDLEDRVLLGRAEHRSRERDLVGHRLRGHDGATSPRRRRARGWTARRTRASRRAPPTRRR